MSDAPIDLAPDVLPEGVVFPNAVLDLRAAVEALTERVAALEAR